MSAAEANADDASLYNQHVTDDELRDTIRKWDEDGVYSSLENGDIVLDDDAIERLRSQLETLEADLERVWQEFAEAHGTGYDGSTDDYLLVGTTDWSAEISPAFDDVDDDAVDVGVVHGAVMEVVKSLRDTGYNNNADTVVPLPDDVTLNDVEDLSCL